MNAPADNPGSERRIAHLDMDAFYASVELLRRPDLRGQPVAIGGRGDPNSRAVVTTATYEARAFGIGSGMGLRRAAQLCPHCVFLPVDFDEYRRFSRLFKAAVAEVAPQMEDRGIDEIYLDLTGQQADGADRGRLVADALRARVQEATGGLTCSIGIAGNKLLAKIASDMNKPDGVTILEAADIPSRLWPLPARRINGVGPKAEQRLQEMGIQTIGELAGTDPRLLVRRFGESYGRWLHEAAHGRDSRPIVTHSEPVSRSRETTFERDLHPVRDRPALQEILERLAAQLARDLASRGYQGRTIGIKVRYDDFTTLTRDLSVSQPTADPRLIGQVAGTCLDRVPARRRLRLLGVRAGNLSRLDGAANNTLVARDPANDQTRGRAGAVPYTRDLFDPD